MQSGLRGRGGAGFPTGIKWKHRGADAQAAQKYVVCNADEGDSGTFADRMLMEGDPFVLIEGMAIAGFAVGATKGYVYTRSEYPHAIATFDEALNIARARGLLGANVADGGFAFDIELRVGAGAYVCGEETSLLDSLEGKRGQVRAKPPLPAHQGLFGMPDGDQQRHLARHRARRSSPTARRAITALGMGRSRGTMPIQLAGNITHGGLFEAASASRSANWWTTSAAARRPAGRCARCRSAGRSAPISRRAVRHAVRLRGVHGEGRADRPWRRRGVRRHGGHGRQARFAMEFCAVESCGKCTPCRIGSTRGVEVMDTHHGGEQRRCEPRAADRSVQHDEVRLAVRAGRLHAVPGDERADAFPGRFRRPAPGARRPVEEPDR